MERYEMKVQRDSKVVVIFLRLDKLSGTSIWRVLQYVDRRIYVVLERLKDRFWGTKFVKRPNDVTNNKLIYKNF